MYPGGIKCGKPRCAGKSYRVRPAPLILKNDGKFELRGWEGSYLVDGQWVELSDSAVRSRAKIEPGHKIVVQLPGEAWLVRNDL